MKVFKKHARETLPMGQTHYGKSEYIRTLIVDKKYFVIYFSAALMKKWGNSNAFDLYYDESKEQIAIRLSVGGDYWISRTMTSCQASATVTDFYRKHLKDIEIEKYYQIEYNETDNLYILKSWRNRNDINPTEPD